MNFVDFLKETTICFIVVEYFFSLYEDVSLGFVYKKKAEWPLARQAEVRQDFWGRGQRALGRGKAESPARCRGSRTGNTE